MASEELRQDLDKLKGLLAHKHPKLTYGQLIEIMAEMTLEKLDPAREPKRKSKKKMKEENVVLCQEAIQAKNAPNGEVSSSL